MKILDSDLEVYISHLDKLREAFKICFGDLDNMHVLEWQVTPFDMKMDNKGYESDIEDELIEMHVDLKPKMLYKSKNLSDYWSNINTATKYPKLRAADKTLFLAFQTSYMAETGLSHVKIILTKQRNRLNL